MVGLAASLAFGRAMATLVFGVRPTDPLTSAATTAVVFAIALGVCYLPARRAAAADPVELLRSE
jgi:ABC-type lipoprotein release transport system permease subunit